MRVRIQKNENIYNFECDNLIFSQNEYVEEYRGHETATGNNVIVAVIKDSIISNNKIRTYKNNIKELCGSDELIISKDGKTYAQLIDNNYTKLSQYDERYRNNYIPYMLIKSLIFAVGGVKMTVFGIIKRKVRSFHRNLNPENIFCSLEHDVKIPSLTNYTPDIQTSTGIKAARYYSNRLIKLLENGDTPDDAVYVESNIFSIGVILYELLTGKVLFNHTSLEDIKKAHRNELPNIDKTTFPDGMPDGIKHVLKKIFSAERYNNSGRHPEDTYKSFYDLLRDINNALFDESAAEKYRKNIASKSLAEVESVLPDAYFFNELMNIHMKACCYKNEEELFLDYTPFEKGLISRNTNNYVSVYNYNNINNIPVILKKYDMNNCEINIKIANLKGSRREIRIYNYINEKEKRTGVRISPRLYYCTLGTEYETRALSNLSYNQMEQQLTDAIDDLYKNRRTEKINHIALMIETGLPYKSYLFYIKNATKGNPEKRDYYFVKIAEKLINAMISLHNIGIYHLDIKPDNAVIIKNSNGICQLTFMDYNISSFRSVYNEQEMQDMSEKLMINNVNSEFLADRKTELNSNNDETLTCSGCGTTFYWSPEMQIAEDEMCTAYREHIYLNGRSYANKFDVYSLSVMLFAMIMLDNPFSNELAKYQKAENYQVYFNGDQSAMAKILYTDASALDKIIPSTEAMGRLINLIKKGLMVDYNKRISSQEMKKEMDNIISTSQLYNYI